MDLLGILLIAGGIIYVFGGMTLREMAKDRERAKEKEMARQAHEDLISPPRI